MIYLLLGLSVNEFSAIVIVCVDGLDFFQSHYCVFGGRYILRSWSIPSQVCLLLRFRKSLYFVSLFSWTLLSVLSITPFSVVVIFCVLDFFDSSFRSVYHSVFGSRYILCLWFLGLFFQVNLSLRFRQSLYFVSLISWTLVSGLSITAFSAVVVFCADSLMSKDGWVITLVVTLGLVSSMFLFFIVRQPQNKSKLNFQVKSFGGY